MGGKPRGVKMRVVPALVVIASFIWAFASYAFLSKKETIVSSVLTYTGSSTSIFFPSLPSINLLWFLPKSLQVLPFTIGQFIDLFIIITLLMQAQFTLYPIFKQYGEGKATSLDFELYRLEFKSKSEDVRITCKREVIMEKLREYDDYNIRIEAHSNKDENTPSLISKFKKMHDFYRHPSGDKIQENGRLLHIGKKIAHHSGKPSVFLEKLSNFDISSSVYYRAFGGAL